MFIITNFDIVVYRPGDYKKSLRKLGSKSNIYVVASFIIVKIVVLQVFPNWLQMNMDENQWLQNEKCFL